MCPGVVIGMVTVGTVTEWSPDATQMAFPGVATHLSLLFHSPIHP